MQINKQNFIKKEKEKLQYLMTEKFNKTINSKVYHNKFGGIIYPSDFNTNYASGTIAKRISRDLKFDEQCRRNCINRYKTERIN